MGAVCRGAQVWTSLCSVFVCLSSAAQGITKLEEYFREWFDRSSKVCRASPQPRNSLPLPHSGICCVPTQGMLSCAACVGAPGSCHCHARNIVPGPVLQCRPGHLASEVPACPPQRVWCELALLAICFPLSLLSPYCLLQSSTIQSSTSCLFLFHPGESIYCTWGLF